VQARHPTLHHSFCLAQRATSNRNTRTSANNSQRLKTQKLKKINNSQLLEKHPVIVKLYFEVRTPQTKAIYQQTTKQIYTKKVI
jgi:hypothetical protein